MFAGMPESAPHPLARSFERHLRAANRSPRTVGNHLDSIRQIQAFLAPLGRDLADAGRRDLEASWWTSSSA